MPSPQASARSLREQLIRPTLPELWTFLAIALPGLAALVATLPTVDLAYQLRAGAEILSGAGIPSVDTWTFTAAGQPWLDQQWGAQAILAAVYGAAGWTGLAILRAAVVALAFGLILVAIRRRVPGINPRVAAWLALAAFIVTAPALALRPQLFGMACFALTLALLAGRRQRPREAWLVPVVAIAWANVHGSFILAPALVGLAWLEDVGEGSARARHTFAVGLATGVATLATPFGLDAWRYAAGIAVNREVTARISEWQPPTPTDVPGILFWASVVLVAVAVAAMARRRGRIAWPAIASLVAFAALGAVAARGTAWWPGVAAVTLAGIAAPMWTRVSGRPGRGSRLNALVGAALVVAGVAVLPPWRSVDSGLDAPRGLLAQAPSGVTAALRDLAGPADRVWNPQAWGSWFELAVPAPAYALDTRFDVIPSDAWADGDLIASAGPGWDDVLDARRATIVVANGPPATPLAAALAGSPTWRLVHGDDDGSVWVRSDR